MKITTTGLSYLNLYKLLIIGHLVSFIILCIIFGIASFFGYHTISINGEYVTGLKGLIAGIILGPIFALIFGTINWLFVSFGLWLYTRVRVIEIG